MPAGVEGGEPELRSRAARASTRAPVKFKGQINNQLSWCKCVMCSTYKIVYLTPALNCVSCFYPWEPQPSPLQPRWVRCPPGHSGTGSQAHESRAPQTAVAGRDIWGSFRGGKA